MRGAWCPHLEQYTVYGRRWACGLRRRAGSWAAAALMPEYQAIQEIRRGISDDMVECAGWPGDGRECRICGE